MLGRLAGLISLLAATGPLPSSPSVVTLEDRNVPIAWMPARRQSVSRANHGRTGGGAKKRKAKCYARARGRRLSRR